MFPLPVEALDHKRVLYCDTGQSETYSSPTPLTVDHDVLDTNGTASPAGPSRVPDVLPYDRPVSPNTPNRRPSAYSAPKKSWPDHVFACALPLLEFEKETRGPTKLRSASELRR